VWRLGRSMFASSVIASQGNGAERKASDFRFMCRTAENTTSFDHFIA